jgi:NADH-quinone oxidoreductase subunit J
VDTLDRIEIIKAIVVIVLGASGTWLLLPHRHGRLKPIRAYIAGAALTTIAFLTMATLWTPPSSFITAVFFYVFALTAIGAGVMTITSRDPVYSALWFAAVVLATSGLFLLSGAQFLAAGTIIVYAGAIIVTFLFVIMLAQKEGRATYDRMARSPGRATLTCFLIFWSLIYALFLVKTPDRGPSGRAVTRDDLRVVRGSELLQRHMIRPSLPISAIVKRSLTETNRLPEPATRGEPALGRHIAGLGGTLYTDHLVTVELAGVLLFVALIGALSIASPKPPVRPGQANPPPPAS